MYSSSATAVTDCLANHPIDCVEQAMLDRDWDYDRPNDEELLSELSGQWCQLRFWFVWQEHASLLGFSCLLDTKAPPAKRDQLMLLLGRINEHLWLGHFDLSSEDGSIAFRHGLPVPQSQQEVGTEPVHVLLDAAIAECSRVYPAIQSLLWGEKSPDEALALAMFDTVGEA